MQLSLYGDFARHHGHRPTRAPAQESGGLRIGLVMPSDATDRRRIHNVDEFIEACGAHAGALSCEVTSSLRVKTSHGERLGEHGRRLP